MTRLQLAYFNEDGDPQMQPSIVAFVDILGYQDLIIAARDSGDEKALLALLHRTLKAAINHLNELNEDGEPYLPKDSWLEKPFKTQTFTDNIVIGYPYYRDGEFEMGDVFSKLAFFQLAMVNAGFFIRGAIAVGDLFIDEITVFGPGLIDSYVGESSDARDPRIILTGTARDAVLRHVKYYGNPKHSPQARELFHDADGQFFLNYLDTILIAEYEQGPFFEELEKHKSAIDAKLTAYRDRPKIWSKYAWTANYHNYFCDQHGHFDDSHKIDISQFQMRPSSIV